MGGVRAGDGGAFVIHPNPTHSHIHTLTRSQRVVLPRVGSKGGWAPNLEKWSEGGPMKGGTPKVGRRRVGGPNPEKWGLEKWRPKTPKMSLLFFSPTQCFIVSLSGSMLVECWWRF